eukprot:scaffold127841_cov28-Tisochrysis_lutea.AAC.1
MLTECGSPHQPTRGTCSPLRDQRAIASGGCAQCVLARIGRCDDAAFPATLPAVVSPHSPKTCECGPRTRALQRAEATRAPATNWRPALLCPNKGRGATLLRRAEWSVKLVGRSRAPHRRRAQCVRRCGPFCQAGASAVAERGAEPVVYRLSSKSTNARNVAVSPLAACAASTALRGPARVPLLRGRLRCTLACARSCERAKPLVESTHGPAPWLTSAEDGRTYIISLPAVSMEAYHGERQNERKRERE